MTNTSPKQERKVRLKITPVGPGGSDHNLICWVCGKEPAVYDMYPNWIFRPCWKCQSNGVGNGLMVNKNWLKKLIRFLFFKY